MSLQELGLTLNEFKWLESWQKKLQSPSDPDLIMGLGDDAAVCRVNKDQTILLATDMLCQGVHFEDQEDPYMVGRKALAVNLSDIAAMAGQPQWALVALALPTNYQKSYADQIMQGISDLAKSYDVSVVGGDTTRSRQDLCVAVSIFGQALEKGPVFRKGARLGDAIMVTGSLGGSLASGTHLSFTPRVKEALFLKAHYSIHAMMDLSDGLAQDLRQLITQSDCGALLFPHKIPICKSLHELDHNTQLRHALCDGEDFELIFTLPKKEAFDLEKKLLPTQCPVSMVGEVIEEKGLYWKSPSKTPQPIHWRGYEHCWDS